MKISRETGRALWGVDPSRDNTSKRRGESRLNSRITTPEPLPRGGLQTLRVTLLDERVARLSSKTYALPWGMQGRSLVCVRRNPKDSGQHTQGRDVIEVAFRAHGAKEYRHLSRARKRRTISSMKTTALSLVLGAMALSLSTTASCGEIHDAAKTGDVETIRVLLKANPELVNNRDNPVGWTPLHVAAQAGHKEVAELLLANKADVNATVSGGWTPLHLATDKDHKEVVELLLANKADANATDNRGMTPLHWAADKDHKEVAELLLANRADVNAKDNRGMTPLHWAAQAGHKEVAELLLANKADVNAKTKVGWTPLHWAAERGHKEVAKLLLASKAVVDLKDYIGMTPLRLALDQGHIDIADFLRAHGAKE